MKACNSIGFLAGLCSCVLVVPAAQAQTSHPSATALTLDAAPAPQPGWADQVKYPTPWFNWGADERIRYEYIPNIYLTDADPPGHNWSVERLRSRVWGSLVPCEAFRFNARIAYEPKYYWEPESRENWDPSQGLVDNLNAVIKLPQIGTTITVGRQDMSFGNGWLILEGTPLDGSRTIYFDAARATVDVKSIQTCFDGVLLYDAAYANAWLPAINNVRRAQIEQDETGAFLYATNKTLKATQLEGYFIYKHENKVLANGNDGDIYTPGIRAIRDFDKHWTGRVEAAYQFGSKNEQDVSAWGANSRLTCQFRDDLKSQVWLGYEALSGDDPGTRANEQFEPLWARWPQWSELYVYTFANETRIAEISNLQRINLGWQCEPTRKLTLAANYHALFAFENNRAGVGGFGDNGKFRGHLLTGIASYNFNRFLSGNLEGELLLPGNYYDDSAGGPFDTRRDPAAYLRAEMLVSF